KEDLERCRSLAKKLGLALVMARQEQGVEEEEEHQGERGKAERLAGGPAQAGRDGFKFTMLFDETGRLALGQPGSGFNPLVVDFCGGKTGHRSKHQQGKSEQVVKAAALPKRRAATAAADAPLRPPSPGDDDAKAPLPLLWDLTAGLGTDAFLLAQAGWRVEMFERSPVVAALVQDALDRARVGDDETTRTAASRMSLTVADSTEVLATAAVGSSSSSSSSASVASASRPDVVYLDPMFPQQKKGKKTKSALVKKGMQMLQALLEEEDGAEGEKRQQGIEPGGHTPDGTGGGDVAGEGEAGAVERQEEERRLFDIAMKFATRKVVVKRPVHGPSLVRHVQPSHAVVSKNGRFDVYVAPP
ncbi:unnamed protein product, partial [Ectocarpus sp. 13 AM-2016]